MLQITEGNVQLAQAVKDTATAQQNAKLISEQQAVALDKLGISIEAVNQGMSKSGLEMVQTLQTGITAIKEQTTSATALKTALQQAFDTAVMSAKTQQDFTAIKQAIEQAGLAGQLTAGQMRQLNAGMQTGAEGIKQLKAEIDKQNKALDDNTNKTQSNTQSKQNHANASKEQAQATEQATLAQEKNSQSIQKNSNLMGGIAKLYDNYSATIANGLQNVGITAEQTGQIVKKNFHDNFYGGIAPIGLFLEKFGQLQRRTKENIQNFNDFRQKVIDTTTSLNGSTVSSHQLAHAQSLLKVATQMSFNGIVKLDKATLNNLNQQIENTQSKVENTRRAMIDLVNQAKNMSDSLEVELARLKGDDSLALKIEQNKKLAEIEQKITEARQRNNADEIAQLQRALALQKQINAEQTRQAIEKKQKTQQQALAEKQQNQQLPSSDTAQVDTKELQGAFRELMEKAKKDGQQELLKTLADDVKRLAK